MKQREQSTLLPGAQEWELWPSAPTDAQTAATLFPTPGEVPAQKIGTVGIPVLHLHSLPLWIIKTDEVPLGDLVRAQLDRRGLLGPHQSNPFHYRVVAEESARRLIQASVLAPAFPEELSFTAATRFEPSPSFYQFPENSIALWKEAGRFAVAITRGSQLAHYQSLGNGSLDAEATAELRCILLQMIGQAICSNLRKIVVWEPISKETSDFLERELGIPVETRDRPAPKNPESPADLVPASVRAAHAAEAKNQILMRWVAAAAVVYLIILGIAGSQLALRAQQIAQLKANLKTVGAPVEEAQATFARWNALTLALNPQTYPLERLFQAASLLPAEGVRLVEFNQTGTKILLIGEARNAPAAFAFAESLKKSPQWKSYQWQIPQPKLLPNGSALFQIEAKPANPGAITQPI